MCVTICGRFDPDEGDRQKPDVAPDVVPAQTEEELPERLYIKRFRAVPFLCGQKTSQESQSMIKSETTDLARRERKKCVPLKRHVWRLERKRSDFDWYVR